MKSNLKGAVFGLEALIAITLFFAVFSAFIAKMSIAGSAILSQESALSTKLITQAQVQGVAFVIDASGMDLAAAKLVLASYFGNRFSISVFNPVQESAANNSMIARILTVDGIQYSLMVGNNENAN